MSDWNWHYIAYTTTTDNTNPVTPRLPDSADAEEIAFLRAAVKLAHERIDELEGDGA